MDVIDSDSGDFAPEVAQAILKWRFPELFCLSRTLSFKDVLEFSTDEREKLDVKKKAFIA